MSHFAVETCLCSAFPSRLGRGFFGPGGFCKRFEAHTLANTSKIAAMAATLMVRKALPLQLLVSRSLSRYTWWRFRWPQSKAKPLAPPCLHHEHRTQDFEPMLGCFEAMAIDTLDALALQPGLACTTDVRYERRQHTSAIPHQCRCGVGLSAIELCKPRQSTVPPHLVMLGRPHRQKAGGATPLGASHHRRLKTTTHGGIASARCEHTTDELIRSQHALQRLTDHDRDGTLCNKPLKHCPSLVASSPAMVSKASRLPHVGTRKMGPP